MRWVVSRVVMAPAIIALTVLIWVTFPLAAIITAALSPLLPGKWRPLRVFWIFLLYITCETLMLLVMFVLWLSSGFGRWLRTPYFEGIHYDLVQMLLVFFFREARRVARLKITTVGTAPDAYPGTPLIVCCRHAGPGDSFTLMYALMHWYGREPRVVLKDTLAWDPMIAVVLSRIPARFIAPHPQPGTTTEEQVGALAAGLDENDAFVIFPEGGNFTPARRERAIERLRRLGLERMADRAEAMTHVLAPRPGGLLAALDAAPSADVVLVAHTGLDHLFSIGDVWRELPMDKQIIMRWWSVPRSSIPTDRDERIDWLFGWWEQIDAWVSEHRPVDLPPRPLLRRTP